MHTPCLACKMAMKTENNIYHNSQKMTRVITKGNFPILTFQHPICCCPHIASPAKHYPIHHYEHSGSMQWWKTRAVKANLSFSPPKRLQVTLGKSWLKQVFLKVIRQCSLMTYSSTSIPQLDRFRLGRNYYLIHLCHFHSTTYSAHLVHLHILEWWVKAHSCGLPGNKQTSRQYT